MSSEAQTQAMIEVLNGINITDDTVELFVISNGCTTKENFHVDVNTGFTGQSPVIITVYRIKSDDCKMMPHVVKLTYSKKELKIDGLFETTLINKIGNTSSGR
jgi:hypothetical protein